MESARQAENALVNEVNATLFAPNIPLRRYWLQKNRISRNLRKYWPGLGQNLVFETSDDIFLFLMWIDEELAELLQTPSKRKLIYLFDAWEPQWRGILEQACRWKNVAATYFASSQAAAYFRSRVSFPTLWVPQAADPEEFIGFKGGHYPERENLIVNIGRPNQTLNRFFMEFSNRHGFQYLAQQTTEGILYPTRSDFIRTLLSSRVVVVHTRDRDAPEMTGCVSMLTARYFEAFNAGAVVCGFRPASGEFEKVLPGYPFVEYKNDVQFEDDLLNALDSHQVWLHAQQRVRAEHSWAARVADLRLHTFLSS